MSKQTAEAMYDRYDDNGEYDAITLRAMTGLRAEGSNEQFTTDAIHVRMAREASANHKNGFEGGGLANAMEADPRIRDRYLTGASMAHELLQQAAEVREIKDAG